METTIFLFVKRAFITKKCLLFAAFLTLSFTSNLLAQRRIVLQHNGQASVYEELDSLKVHLQSGDTIYFPGRGYNIGTWLIDKKVTIFGAGHYPDSTIATGTTFFIGNITLKTGADNTFIQGLHLSGDIRFGSDATNQTVNNITVSRCSMYSMLLSYNGSAATVSNNIHIRENVVRNVFYGGYAIGVLVNNNFFNQVVANFGNTLFKNNIFMGTYCENNLLRNINNSSFQNNVFVPFLECGMPLIDVCNGNDFQKNAFKSGQTFPYATNTGSGNWNSINPSAFFVNWSTYSFSYTQNYHLQAPATYSGTDGTQIGIYGGLNPYKEGAVPINPHIQSKTIAPATNTSGELNINIKVAAQNY